MNDNIFNLVPGGKTEDSKLPQNTYEIVDVDDNAYLGYGFLIFTTHHVAIMMDTPLGAIPSVVIPLGRLKVVEIVNDEELVEE